VHEHVETFCAQAASLREGEGLPRFVEAEFRDFLRCGSLAGGFARFQCGTCGLDRFVAFSCKGRGSCPSCGSRRMTERAAHLVDHVFPNVPVRQWVLSLPYRLRYRLAWDHDLCRAVVAVGPRKRPFHTIIPAFVTRTTRTTGVLRDATGDEPYIAFGVMGGAMQPQWHVQVLLNLLVFGMDPQAAVDAARFRHTTGKHVVLESPIGDAVRAALARLGHEVGSEHVEFGGAQVMIKLVKGWAAASDPRKDGLAIGY